MLCFCNRYSILDHKQRYTPRFYGFVLGFQYSSAIYILQVNFLDRWRVPSVKLRSQGNVILHSIYHSNNAIEFQQWSAALCIWITCALINISQLIEFLKIRELESSAFPFLALFAKLTARGWRISFGGCLPSSSKNPEQLWNCDVSEITLGKQYVENFTFFAGRVQSTAIWMMICS